MAIKSGVKKPPTAYVMRYAHPFFTSTPHATRPQTSFGKRMLDWAKQELGPIPKPVRAGKMGLAEIIGDKGVSEISQAGEIRFHATGDTGNLHSQSAENVSQQMAADFDVNHPGQNPAFLFHLGDVIYGPHKSASYRDEFYRPYKGYPGKIIAVPGNHDGEIFYRNGSKVIAGIPGQFLRQIRGGAAGCSGSAHSAGNDDTAWRLLVAGVSICRSHRTVYQLRRRSRLP